MITYPSERSKELLRRHAAQEITIADLMLECAMWTLEPDCFSQYTVKQYDKPPTEWTEYEALPIDRRYKISDTFFQQPNIKNYTVMKNRVYAQNYGEHSWLCEVKKLVAQNEQLENKIYEYRVWLKNSTKELEDLANTFNGTVQQEVF